MKLDIQDFEEWYEDHKDLPPQHDASLEPITDYPMANNCLSIILGATGSGKSHILKDIFDNVPYNIIFFISPTGSFDQTHDERPMACDFLATYNTPKEGIEKVYEYLMRRLKLQEFYREFEDLVARKMTGENITNQQLEDAYDKIRMVTNGLDKELFSMDNRVAVVLDDCGYDSKELKKKNSDLSKLIMIRRHLGISLMACLQSYVQTDADIRRNKSDLIITKKVNNKDLDSLFDELDDIEFGDILSSRPLFRAFVKGMMFNKRYDNVQFLFRGFKHNFEDVSREEVINILRKHKQIQAELRKKIDL